MDGSRRPISLLPTLLGRALGGARHVQVKLPGATADPTPMPAGKWLSAVAAALLICSVGLVAEARRAPSPVATKLTLRNGNWYPLAAEEMKAAARDGTLAEISSAGLLEIVDSAAVSGNGARTGTLQLDLYLIGKAETAQMTVTLSRPAQPTFVSRASISVRHLDYRDIYRALGHVGRQAALRLNAKLRALEISSTMGDAAAPPEMRRDPALQRLFDDAQRAKHALRYDEARTLFERVSQSEGDNQSSLREMARDELRYGLPAFEAMQSILGTSQRIGDAEDKLQQITRAEHLYRQIQAENPQHTERVVEAQRALDHLALARTALRSAMWSVSVARMAHLRMAMTEFLVVEGQCPGKKFVEQILGDMPFPLELLSSGRDGPGPARYAVVDPSTDVEVQLVCDRDVRIENPPARRR